MFERLFCQKIAWHKTGFNINMHTYHYMESSLECEMGNLSWFMVGTLWWSLLKWLSTLGVVQVRWASSVV